MKKSISGILLLIAVVIVGFWAWRILFPSSDQVIRSRLAGHNAVVCVHV